MLIPGREDDPGDVGAVASALSRGGSFDGAGVAEKFDKAALFGGREDLPRVRPGGDVDARVSEPWPDALDAMAEYAGARRPLDVAHRGWLDLLPPLDIYEDELVGLGDDGEQRRVRAPVELGQSRGQVNVNGGLVPELEGL